MKIAFAAVCAVTALLAAACPAGAAGVEPDGETLEMARRLAEAGRSDEAVRRLMDAAGKRLDRGDPRAARRLLERAAEMRPESAAVHSALGRALLLEKEYPRAEEALGRALELGAADLPTRFYLATAAWESGRPAAAEAACREALETHGRKPFLLHLLGRLLLWQGRFDEAAEVLRESVALAPDALESRIDLARALDGADRVPEAIAAYRQAIERAPLHAEIRYGLARLLARAGREDEARREMEIYRRLYEDDQERARESGLEAARIARGRELLRAGEPGAALHHLEALDPSADALAAIAAAHRALGDPRAAVAALERAVAAQPGRDDVRDLLIEAYLALEEEP